MKNMLLGEALLANGWIEREQLDIALGKLREERTNGGTKRIGDIFVDAGLMERQFLESFVQSIHGTDRQVRSNYNSQEPNSFISTSAGDAAAVRYLNNLLSQAAREHYSDIHFEDVDDGCLIRARRNGEMFILDHVYPSYSREFDNKIRMKCKLSIVERMTPLDGKFFFESEKGSRVDVRVSILPLARGQSIVCRLLDQKNNIIALEEIEMPDDIRKALVHIINQPQGLFLVTGPTGSGKTTTLYALLQKLNSNRVKIVTVEDPVEYKIVGINQAQTNNKLTFAGALKSMLRQDPDIILVGEIRDSETARIATQAALTGHIVLSTLHTNNALVTLSRMLDLEVDPNALSAATGGFMAQRLLRKLCSHCRCPVLIDNFARYQLEQNGVDPQSIDFTSPIFEQGPGCSQCSDGWAGRLPVFELITTSHDVRAAIEDSNIKALERSAKLQPQYRSLGHHAMQLVLRGETSIAEATLVTGSSSVPLDLLG